MDSKVVGQGSQYMAAFVDSNGNPLDGGKNYRLHLPPNIPVANFWSVILYDNQTRSMLQTDQDWPSVSSQTKGLLVNPDEGSKRCQNGVRSAYFCGQTRCPLLK